MSEPDPSEAPGPPIAASAAAAAGAPGLRAQFRHRDHTRGSLWTSLFVLAVPLLATSLSTVVYQLVDLKFIASIGEQAVSAVVVTNQSFRQIVMILLMGASFGAQGMISRLVGEGRIADAEHVAGQVATAGAAIALLVALAGLAFGREMLSVMNVSPAVAELALPYLRITFTLGFGWIFVTLLGAVLNGAGDATTPMIVMIVQTSVSLVTEYLLVYGMLWLPALRIESIAIGQAIGQGLGVAISFAVLFRGASRVHVRLRHLAPDPVVMRAFFAQAWAPALQMFGTFAVNFYFLRLAGSFGDKAQTAYSIGLRIAMAGPMLAFPLAGACATLVGQNLGAGSVRRAWKSLWVGLAAHATLLVSVGVALLVFRVPFVSLFTDDPEVLALGSELLVYQGFAFVGWAFYFVFFRALQGAGDVVVPMVMATGNALFVTLPVGWYLATQAGWGPSGLFAATLAGAVTVTAATSVYVLSGRWTRPFRTAR
ncbi:MAG: MATE family efflux transporter [Myxococcota bacterium]